MTEREQIKAIPKVFLLVASYFVWLVFVSNAGIHILDVLSEFIIRPTVMTAVANWALKLGIPAKLLLLQFVIAWGASMALLMALPAILWVRRDARKRNSKAAVMDTVKSNSGDGA
jgi:hypothetical protein